MKLPFRLAAAALALSPTAAWAHGDHDGLQGLVHLVTSFGHYGLILLGALGVALVARRWRASRRDDKSGRNDRA